MDELKRTRAQLTPEKSPEMKKKMRSRAHIVYEEDEESSFHELQELQDKNAIRTSPSKKKILKRLSTGSHNTSSKDATNEESKSTDITPPVLSTNIMTEEEMEKRRRRRLSKAFQQRRKSFTADTKQRQYVSDMYSTIIKMSSENVRIQKKSIMFIILGFT